MSDEHDRAAAPSGTPPVAAPLVPDSPSAFAGANTSFASSNVSAFSPAQILALQRSAGNGSVARLLSRQSVPAAAPPAGAQSPVAAKPKIQAITSSLEKRKRDAATRRGGDPYRDDTLIVRAQLDQPAVDSGSAPDFVHRIEGAEVAVQGEWQGQDAYVWKLDLRQIGHVHAFFTATSKDGVAAKHEEHLAVHGDLKDFSDRLRNAQGWLGTEYKPAVDARVAQATSRFQQALDKQQAALADVKASEKLRDDMLVGVVMAVVGGAVGGAVGARAKGAIDAGFGKDAAKSTAGEAAVDAGKDFAKWLTRTLGTLGLQPGGGSSAPKGSGGDTPDTPGTKPRGEREASGRWQDFFLKMSQDANAHVGTLGAQIRVADEEVQHAANKDADKSISEDPLTVLQQDPRIAKMSETLDKPMTDYLRELWHTWLANYAWQYGQDPMHIGIAPKKNVHFNVPGKLRDKIDAAAAECGESGDAWIDQYGSKARESAENDEARADGKPEPHPAKAGAAGAGGGAP